ncbi:MAG: hypothetical protein QM651_02410 [Rhodoblastus sp.]
MGDADASTPSVDLAAQIEDYAQRRAEDAMARAGLAFREAIAISIERQRAAQAAWSSECQDRVSQEAAAAREAFEHKVSQCLARILAPFVETRQRERIRAFFVSQVAAIFAETPDIVVMIDGPTADCRIVAGSLGKIGVRTALRENESDRLEAEIGSTIVRASFHKWSRQLAAILDGIDSVDE